MMMLAFRTTSASFYEMGDAISFDAIAETLRYVAEQVATGRTGGKIYDGNGNSVGSWALGDN